MKAVVIVSLITMTCLGMAGSALAEWPFGTEQPKKVEKPQPWPAVTMSGRFQIFISPHLKGYTFMIDTDTGRVWEMKKDPSTGNFHLSRVLVEEVDKGKSEKSPREKGAADKPPKGE